ncbi:hypothetical protein [Piscinibacter sakaiensis]|uniref:DUF2325 domain-containing protein n=1 Tax=Piscinibacter sakaiensis TaxID=1547922 RepID=A0A0K8NXX6_PISS1|nr:hypothetical protein [Piscinibacter sakaiensis]GAP35223.1 hypothetical protein ISF6_0814 [Piscinibacter sakaiensis]
MPPLPSPCPAQTALRDGAALPPPGPWSPLACEHRALLQAYGRAQQRCSDELQARAREVERLEGEVLRLRAALLVRDSADAWAREDRRGGQAHQAGEAREARGARTADEAREAGEGRLATVWPPVSRRAPLGEADPLAAAVRAADLVICQTGCLGQGAAWRVQDLCRRSGTPCVLVRQPARLRIVQVRPGERGAAATATLATLADPVR